jgi:hypothetical protein
MKKQIIIIAAIVLAVIIGCVFYAHYVPVWVLLCTILAFLVGGAIGWYAKVLYDKLKNK